MKRWILLAWLGVAMLRATDVGSAPLLFREDWTETSPAIPLTQRDVANPA